VTKLDDGVLTERVPLVTVNTVSGAQYYNR